ncbi:MAG TPA: flagellum-specific ATP synthase FliI [Parvularcula sp.]|nr:flagellum-specific ATP synthase FliI [Parvularcula sp.]
MIEPALIESLRPSVYGAIAAVDGAKLRVGGLARFVRVGDRLSITREKRPPLIAETYAVERDAALAYAFESTEGVTAGARAELRPDIAFARPSKDWLGRVLNWRGETIDGAAPRGGARAMRLNAPPPPAALRRALGPRLATGMAAFDTFLPLCRGQRAGVFAGSGVGKSTLLSSFAAGVDADVCVLALIGERGREVRSFVEAAREAGILDKTVVIASTSDEPPLARRESARLALAVAEYFRREGAHALLVFDSLTRFADAHREIALAKGEPPSLHAYPPSTVSALAALVERAGPGVEGEGDITAVFSVLVAGSDMEEPVADMVRGLLDGHIVLDRTIAERGRFPAVNIRRSVSRSLPAAASAAENGALLEARRLLAAYENAELVLRAGLYVAGADAATDRAIALFPRLDAFIAQHDMANPEESFARLQAILRSN